MLTLLLLTLFMAILGLSYGTMRRYRPLRPYRFSHHNEPQLPASTTTSQMRTMASQYRLHDLVADCDTDMERIDTLMQWVLGLWEPDSRVRAGTDNPLDILSRAHKSEPLGRRDYVTVLANALQALDMPTRFLEIHARDSQWRLFRGHYQGLEVYLSDQRRWCWVDAQTGVILVNQRHFCGALDIKDAVLARNSELSLHGDTTVELEGYVAFLAPFLDIIIAQPLGQRRRLALVPPQLGFPRRRHGVGRTLYDQLYHSRDVFYADHPVAETPTMPLWRSMFRPRVVSA